MGVVHIIVVQEAKKSQGGGWGGVGGVEPSQKACFHQLDPTSQKLHIFPRVPLVWKACSKQEPVGDKLKLVTKRF